MDQWSPSRRGWPHCPQTRSSIQGNCQLSRAQLPSTFLPWTSWRACHPGGGAGRVASTPSRHVCSRRKNPPWLLSGPVFWTVPHEALVDQTWASTLPALHSASTQVWQTWQCRLECLRRRCLLRGWLSSLISESMVGVTFDQGV